MAEGGWYVLLSQLNQDMKGHLGPLCYDVISCSLLQSSATRLLSGGLQHPLLWPLLVALLSVPPSPWLLPAVASGYHLGRVSITALVRGVHRW